MKPLVRASSLFLTLLWLGVACSGEQSAERDVVARIDGEPILLSEVERGAAWRLYRARIDVHLVLERETERLIEERLLARAARDRGLDVDALLRETEQTTRPVGEEEIDRYLAEHPSDVSKEKARPRIRHYLEERRRIEKRLALLDDLRAAAEIEILLTPPERPLSQLDLTGAPARGPEGAPITILQFADLSAADSARSARQLAQLRSEFPDQIRLLHRSVPTQRDPIGRLTAQLAAAAAAQGKFWPLHDRLSAAGGARRAADLESLAREFDLAEDFFAIVEDPNTLARVQQDLAFARAAGVERAPTLFVNGRYFMALEGYAALRDLVLEELGEKE